MIKKLVFGLTAMAAFAAPASAAVLFGVDVNNNLVRFDSASPGTIQSSVKITGVNDASILGMDIRPNNGTLYALTDSKMIYTINRMTGVATLFANVAALTGTQFAFDFNPTGPVNLRIVSNDDTNYVYNFTTSTLDQNPNGVTGPFASKDIVAAGYLNNDRNPMTGTTLYVIDSVNEQLATQNAATGALTYVGALGFDVNSRASFDILTQAGVNTAFLQSGSDLYTVNLASGAATLTGNTGRDLFALTAAIPEPATWAMMILGFGFIGGALRAQKRRWGTLATA